MTESSPPSAVLCMTGSELTRGETRDANGPYLAALLTTAGVRVSEILLAPDDPAGLARAFARAMDEAEIVLISGGLGPTADDHTIAVLGDVTGRGVMLDPEACERMRKRALTRYREEDIPANYFKQAQVVAGAKVLLNPVGLAPASLVPTRRGFAVALPGVPRELRALFEQQVLPEIQTRFTLAEPRIVRAKILNQPESVAESRIQGLGFDHARIEYGISAQPGELLVKFVVRRLDDRPLLDVVARKLAEEFGDDFLALPEGLLGPGGAPLEVDAAHCFHEFLRARGATVAAAESCTGGLVAKLLTDYPGSSAYFLGSTVAYANRIKTRVLGVPAALVAEHGAVSEPVCAAMALGARASHGSDYAISVTGIAGPDGGTEAKPVGLVYLGVAGPDPGEGPEPRVQVEERRFWGGRDMVRRQAALRAIDLLRRELLRAERTR